jgi:hypothetical protein
MIDLRLLILTVTGAIMCAGCQSYNYAGRGAAVGGLTGGGLGAIIGEAAADKPLAGAAIGSVVGAMTGASVGGALDEIDTKHQQAVYYDGIGTASIGEVVEMSQAGLNDSIITRHIRSRGFPHQLNANDLILLRERGVSDTVIAALQDAPAAVRVAQNQVPVSRPVIVEEHYHGPAYGPVPMWSPPYHRFHHRRRRDGIHWGISFGQ